MDYSLGEYPKLVDALSESLETIQGGIIANNQWRSLYLGYLCLYSKHGPEYKGWQFVASMEENRKEKLWRREMMGLARRNWIGWNRNQKFSDITVSVNILNRR